MKILYADFIVIILIAAFLMLIPASWHHILFNTYPVVILLVFYWLGRYVTHFHENKRKRKETTDPSS